MANLKRNSITLVKEIKAGEVVTETYWTPVFIPLDVIYEAMDLMEKLEDKEANVSEREMFDMLMDFITNKIYNEEFTVEELKKGLHAPQAVNELKDQLGFIVQGEQTNETKKFLEKKR